MDTPLKTSAIQIREEQRMKKDKKDKFEMGMKQVNLSNSNFDRSSSAIRDTKMASLLQKVRQSPTTMNQDFARFTGTSLYNPSEQENRITEQRSTKTPKAETQSPKRKKNKKVISLNSKEVSKLDTLENKVNKKLRFGVKERYVPRPSNIFNIGLNENLTKIL